ncbi:MAG: helix-turn-helix domain-containing protein [Granulosicoccus sp.]|nr:helix-turn-helix domain-containing protein [Granulosicoccus sp.]
MTTIEHSPRNLPCLDELTTEEFLLVVGQRVRQQRARKSMSRKRLAEVSNVSERYLAQLESGQGNMSIALLRKVTSAIGISLGALMSEEVTEACAERTTLQQSDRRTRNAYHHGTPAVVSARHVSHTDATGSTARRAGSTLRADSPSAHAIEV